MRVRCLCIDDSGRPEVVPTSKWVVKDMEYHIKHVYYHKAQGVQGVELSEINLDGCSPYISYRMSRFAIHKDDINKLIQLIMACNSLDDLDINKLLEDVLDECVLQK
jgi:hypothetical protein